MSAQEIKQIRDELASANQRIEYLHDNLRDNEAAYSANVDSYCQCDRLINALEHVKKSLAEYNGDAIFAADPHGVSTLLDYVACVIEKEKGGC